MSNGSSEVSGDKCPIVGGSCPYFDGHPRHELNAGDQEDMAQPESNSGHDEKEAKPASACEYHGGEVRSPAQEDGVSLGQVRCSLQRWPNLNTGISDDDSGSEDGEETQAVDLEDESEEEKADLGQGIGDNVAVDMIYTILEQKGEDGLVKRLKDKDIQAYPDLVGMSEGGDNLLMKGLLPSIERMLDIYVNDEESCIRVLRRIQADVDNKADYDQLIKALEEDDFGSCDLMLMTTMFDKVLDTDYAWLFTHCSLYINSTL